MLHEGQSSSPMHAVSGAGPQAGRAETADRRRLPLAALASIGLALAIFVAVGSVLAVALFGSRLNLVSQLGDRADLSILAITDHLDGHLRPPEHQLAYVARWLAERPDLAAADDRVAEVLRGAMAATPQVISMALMRPDARSVRLGRGESQPVIDDLGWRLDVVGAMREAERRGPSGRPMGWTDPLYSPNIGLPIIVLRQPVWQGDRYLGLLYAAVSLIDLSRYVRDLSGELRDTVFILHGQGHVLAHPKLPDSGFAFSWERPLPTLDELGDEALRIIWSPGSREIISQDFMQLARGHYLRHQGAWQVYVYTVVSDYGPTPWFIGYHMTNGQTTVQVNRFWWMAGIGVALLAAFVLLGLWAGRRLARPFIRLAEGAREVRSLDFASVRPLPRSRIREIDEAAQSFNAMLSGLRWFENYVPRRLVRRLVARGEAAAALTRERELTIMFTDLAGFSTLAERSDARDVAELLNRHFGLLGACIEASGGTIDKYTGDGIMAFWGAPDRQDDHAWSACSAALAIAEAMRRENQARVAAGLPSLHLRIGIHTGRAIVGVIGARERVNYTVVGDTVNVTHRIQDVGRDLPPDDAVILVSAETLAAAGSRLKADLVGTRTVKGRAREVTVYRILALAV